jgi:transposase
LKFNLNRAVMQLFFKSIKSVFLFFLLFFLTVMTIRELITETLTNEQAYGYLQQKGVLISIPFACSRCGSNVTFQKGKIRHGINGLWRCNKKDCKKTYGSLYGSVFDGSKLSILNIVDLLWLYSYRFTYDQIQHETTLTAQTIATYFFMFKSKLVQQLDLFKEGWDITENQIFEVDETHLFSRRDARGQILRGESYWVMGIFCRLDKKCKIRITRRRNAEILCQFIRDHIPQGATVVTDGWRGYLQLRRLGYTHHTINHSRKFVNALNPTVHTNNIERLWRDLKEKVPSGLGLERLEIWIKEYEILRNFDLLQLNERYSALIFALQHDLN